MAMELKEIATGVENSSGHEREEQQQLCDSCKETDYDTSTLAERFCIKCEKKLCRWCDKTHAEEGEHLVVDLNEQNDAKKFKESNFCNDHDEVFAELFCVTCRKVICSDCLKESHSSHNCANVCDIAELVAKQAETEYGNLFHIQSHFDNERMKLASEKIRVTMTVKEMVMEIKKRCDDITQFVYDETNALLKELDTFRKERLDEIEMERTKMEEHAFTFEKFKEYCEKIKNNKNPKHTCEAEGILRNIVDDLKARPEGSWKSGLFTIQFSIQKTDIERLLSSLNSAVGRFIVSCQYRMTKPIDINIGDQEVCGMARLEDKLYVLSDSISIRHFQHPFTSIGKMEIPDFKSPKHIVASSKTSSLYIYDKGEECIWKVSVPGHQLSRWLDKVKEPNALSVASDAELLMLRNNKPVCLEVYNKHAILVRRFTLPATVPPLLSFEETAYGRYVALGEESLFILRTNGSIINQFQPSCETVHKGSPQCFILSPYHIFLQRCSRDYANRPTTCSMTSFTFDLACSQLVFNTSHESNRVAASCYLKETKQLLLVQETASKSWNYTTYNLLQKLN